MDTEVLNQHPRLADCYLFTTDRALHEAVAREREGAGITILD